MLEKMAGQSMTSNVFSLDHLFVGSSNDPAPIIIKKKRNLPGNPDPEAEVIALSPKTLMATNRFLCEVCGKGFQRDQNLQLHRRGHNLPWKLRQRDSKDLKKRVYICPEKACIHHHPSRALGDLTGIKKHFCRKHGEKKWKCQKCSKQYAVQSDCKAHLKICGTREYRCDCGAIFSRRDSFQSHRAFCDALAEETARVTAASHHILGTPQGLNMVHEYSSTYTPFSSKDEAISRAKPGLSMWNTSQGSHVGSMGSGTLHDDPLISYSNSDYQYNWIFGHKLSFLSTTYTRELLSNTSVPLGEVSNPQLISVPSLYSTQNYQHQPSQVNMSATALLQKAAQIGARTSYPLLNGSYVINSNNNHVQDQGKYDRSFSLNSTLTYLNTEPEDSVNDISRMSEYSSKRRKTEKDDIEGKTRDFLGVGVEPVCASSNNGKV